MNGLESSTKHNCIIGNRPFLNLHQSGRKPKRSRNYDPVTLVWFAGLFRERFEFRGLRNLTLRSQSLLQDWIRNSNVILGSWNVILGVEVKRADILPVNCCDGVFYYDQKSSYEITGLFPFVFNVQ